MTRKDDDLARPPRRGRPRDPARCQRVMAAARNHFYAHGLERARLDAIAAEAGVSKMTVHSNFGSKEEVFEALKTAVSARWVTPLGSVTAGRTLDLLCFV